MLRVQMKILSTTAIKEDVVIAGKRLVGWLMRYFEEADFQGVIDDRIDRA